MLAMLFRRLYRLLSVATVPRRAVIEPPRRPGDARAGGVLLNLDEFR